MQNSGGIAELISIKKKISKSVATKFYAWISVFACYKHYELVLEADDLAKWTLALHKKNISMPHMLLQSTKYNLLNFIHIYTYILQRFSSKEKNWSGT